jgi:hypothetical protein
LVSFVSWRQNSVNATLIISLARNQLTSSNIQTVALHDPFGCCSFCRLEVAGEDRLRLLHGFEHYLFRAHTQLHATGTAEVNRGSWAWFMPE